MPRLLIGLISSCLLLLVSGCAGSQPKTVRVPVIVTPEVPPHLVEPLPAPSRAEMTHNRDLLQLLADYESLRRRANADRAAVVEILSNDVGVE